MCLVVRCIERLNADSVQACPGAEAKTAYGLGDARIPVTPVKGAFGDVCSYISHTYSHTQASEYQTLTDSCVQACPGAEAKTAYGLGNVWTPVMPVEGAITDMSSQISHLYKQPSLTHNPLACLS